MIEGIAYALGGIGLFLLGMIVMTDGLRGLAGESLQHMLANTTHSPFSGALSGTISTAILQSSSATTVAAIGFVSAGLLTFPHALGVIFGANLGTTITGWLVVLFGFKLKLGVLLLPLIFFGVMLKLFSSGWKVQAGLAVAGFGLIFVGIDTLQQGMVVFRDVLTPEQFPGDSWTGRIELLLIGLLITVITQSSSAGVATALVAVNAGTIELPQAVAMVIGMDVGTTVTAVIASIGGSRETRRTAYSHVVFNLLTAIGALLLLSPYMIYIDQFAPAWLSQNPELALVAFHSGFNLISVIVVLPFSYAFARLMYRLVPEFKDRLVERLDQKLLSEPEVALQTARMTLNDIGTVLATRLTFEINNESCDESVGQVRIQTAIDYVQDYLDEIQLHREKERHQKWLLSSIHVADHLQRLLTRSEEHECIRNVIDDELLRPGVERLASLLHLIEGKQEQGAWDKALQLATQNYQFMDEQRESLRAAVMREVAEQREDVDTAEQRLQAIRWLRRVAYHLSRITHHLHNCEQLAGGKLLVEKVTK
ncbi:Na/Pi cotransporter family protein [Solemya velum gill symbiont]|uniref:Na/Pi cotransporter family protein n=1 Tax=Solemya velum gill symbiont TaxID=2340 RepID=UPI000998DC6B|nr:Na/Pi symporter [Solemya velum gill symbiont]OOY99046.1 hypothetical protein BOW19_06185 [Solemya velum gill symbiont]OOZ01308.1 hypothetical protein BOW20_05845 [Solemya velum gill symbiont]OOZ03529.1 hypothetical protein BOW21_06215 [Solemya velum gill symbiont]OOZ05765.1 hypothetical protein BOW22_06085 [Solemya velum gill symbiont]OOZ07983.1 hypothetical protein BOW23_06085 [Solemya velum gill symbiont]